MSLADDVAAAATRQQAIIDAIRVEAERLAKEREAAGSGTHPAPNAPQ